MDYSFLQCGEGALTVHLGDGIDPAINRRVTALQGAIDGNCGACWTVCLWLGRIGGGYFGCRCVTAATMGRIWILFAATAVCLRRK